MRSSIDDFDRKPIDSRGGRRPNAASLATVLSIKASVSLMSSSEPEVDEAVIGGIVDKGVGFLGLYCAAVDVGGNVGVPVRETDGELPADTAGEGSGVHSRIG